MPATPFFVFVVAGSCAGSCGGAGATPAAFYLGLCRLRGILSPPASATVTLQRYVLPCSYDGAAGGPFYRAAAMVLQAEPITSTPPCSDS